MVDSSSSETINPGFGMKVTLTGIRHRFSKVLQMSTASFYSKLFCKHQRDDSSNSASIPDLILLDVREKEERDLSFIKGSLWVNSLDSTETSIFKIRDAILSKVQENKDVNNVCGTPGNTEDSEQTWELNIVAYCSVGYRSSALINQIQEIKLIPEDIGYVKLHFHNLEGSLFKWANEGRPIVSGDNKPTIYVHPYNSLWGKLLNDNLRKSSI